MYLIIGPSGFIMTPDEVKEEAPELSRVLKAREKLEKGLKESVEDSDPRKEG